MFSFPTVCISEVYTMKLQWLDPLMEDVESLWGVAVLDWFLYEKFKVYFKNTYQGSSGRQATGIQEILMRRNDDKEVGA